MKQILVTMAAVVLGGCGGGYTGSTEPESDPPAEPEFITIGDPIVEGLIASQLKKPHGKLVPRPKFTELDLEKITSLWLADSKITDASLKEVGAKLQNLRSLSLSYTQITDSGLSDVAKLEKLEVLTILTNTQLTETGLKEVVKLQWHPAPNQDREYGSGLYSLGGFRRDLEKLKKLQRIALNNNQITDAGLRELAKLKNLEKLILWSNEITDEGLKEIVKIQQIEKIWVISAKVTKGGMAELKKAMPNCIIVGPNFPR